MASTTSKPCCSLCSDNNPGPMVRSGKIYICRNCSDDVNSKFDMMEFHQKSKPFKMVYPKEIYDYLDQYVVGQEMPKKFLSVAAYNHLKRINKKINVEKSNVLIVGSTGTGKTLLAKTLAKMLDVPLAIADATTLTEAGYVGEDVENILLKLINAANGDIEAAERGIIFIDEIDKIARTTKNVSITRDVSGEGVQQALLKLIEGTTANVPPDGGRKHPEAKYIQMDTSNILFICGGAFNGLEDVINQRLHTKNIGFNKTNNVKKHEMKHEDLITYGMIPEFIGRLPVLVNMEDLTESDLVRILTEPKNSIISQYQELLKVDGVKLQFTEQALNKIANIAMENKSGARGLRSIIEKMMVDVMFNAPGSKNKEIIISDDMIPVEVLHKAA